MKAVEIANGVWEYGTYQIVRASASPLPIGCTFYGLFKDDAELARYPTQMTAIEAADAHMKETA